MMLSRDNLLTTEWNKESREEATRSQSGISWIIRDDDDNKRVRTIHWGLSSPIVKIWQAYHSMSIFFDPTYFKQIIKLLLTKPFTETSFHRHSVIYFSGKTHDEYVARTSLSSTSCNNNWLSSNLFHRIPIQRWICVPRALMAVWYAKISSTSDHVGKCKLEWGPHKQQQRRWSAVLSAIMLNFTQLTSLFLLILIDDRSCPSNLRCALISGTDYVDKPIRGKGKSISWWEAQAI